MFRDFRNYWKNAEYAGPLIPRDGGGTSHLRQLFVTKSSPLRHEVERVFLCLARAKLSPPVAKHAGIERFERGAAGIDRLADVPDQRFPLFITSTEFMKALDTSLDGVGTRFLCAKRCLSSDKRGSLASLAGYYEYDDHDDQPHGSAIDFKDESTAGADSNGEVTFYSFLNLWKKLISNTETKLAPALVWTEITSFLTGSLEAMQTDHGYLSLEEYQALGRKRSKISDERRGDVYGIFLRYLQLKKRHGLWDLGDFVFSLWRRLDHYMGKFRRPSIVVDAIFADEVQDFTQAEIALLLRLTDPRKCFFCGDSAQTIARGVGFRFCDLKLLWKVMFEESVPSMPLPVTQTLSTNYRSHKGCLRLAAEVISLVYNFFPQSIDKLPPDNGVLDGPMPIMVHTQQIEDLLLLLLGNIRTTGAIEFGAHQVVLVRDQESRESLPAELKVAMVLTIYEAKGLEFDDVLIYNFFKDSAVQDWRHISSACQFVRCDNASAIEPLDTEKHKILETELKLLYTAITRARVNVWLYDESPQSKYMFKLFQDRGLARVVSSVSQSSIADETVACFAQSTTKPVWLSRGLQISQTAGEVDDDLSVRRGLLCVASTCLERGGAPKRAQRLRAQVRYIEAMELHLQHASNKQRMHVSAPKCGTCPSHAFRMAAHACLATSQYDEAAVALTKCSEFALAAELQEAACSRV